MGAVAHQARFLEDAEVFGDGWLGDTRAGGQSADRLLAITAQALEQRPAGRVGESTKEGVVRDHGQIITHRLWNAIHNRRVMSETPLLASGERRLAAYGEGRIPSARTVQPSFGKPGALPVEPSQPPAIRPTASSREPFEGK